MSELNDKIKKDYKMVHDLTVVDAFLLNAQPHEYWSSKLEYFLACNSTTEWITWITNDALDYYCVQFDHYTLSQLRSRMLTVNLIFKAVMLTLSFLFFIAYKTVTAFTSTSSSTAIVLYEDYEIGLMDIVSFVLSLIPSFLHFPLLLANLFLLFCFADYITRPLVREKVRRRWV